MSSIKCEYCDLNDRNLFYCKYCDELICCLCFMDHISLRDGIHALTQIDKNNFSYLNKFMKKQEIFDYINERTFTNKEIISDIIPLFMCEKCSVNYKDIQIIFEENRYLLNIKCCLCHKNEKIKIEDLKQTLKRNSIVDLYKNVSSEQKIIDNNVYQEIIEKEKEFYTYINKIIYFFLQNHFRKENAINILNQISDGKFLYEFMKILFHFIHLSYGDTNCCNEQYLYYLYNTIKKNDFDLINLYLIESYNKLASKKKSYLIFH